MSSLFWRRVTFLLIGWILGARLALAEESTIEAHLTRPLYSQVKNPVIQMSMINLPGRGFWGCSVLLKEVPASRHKWVFRAPLPAKMEISSFGTDASAAQKALFKFENHPLIDVISCILSPGKSGRTFARMQDLNALGRLSGFQIAAHPEPLVQTPEEEVIIVQ